MPEEKIEEKSPAKKPAPVPKGRAVLARVTLLDGSLLDISLDVSRTLLSPMSCSISSCIT